jgi:hypothetical protein
MMMIAGAICFGLLIYLIVNDRAADNPVITILIGLLGSFWGFDGLLKQRQYINDNPPD